MSIFYVLPLTLVIMIFFLFLALFGYIYFKELFFLSIFDTKIIFQRNLCIIEKICYLP